MVHELCDVACDVIVLIWVPLVSVEVHCPIWRSIPRHPHLTLRHSNHVHIPHLTRACNRQTNKRVLDCWKNKLKLSLLCQRSNCWLCVFSVFILLIEDFSVFRLKIQTGISKFINNSTTISYLFWVLNQICLKLCHA